MLFSIHQDRDEGWFDLFFSPSFCSCLAYFILYRVNIQCFRNTTPILTVYFLKISKSFWFLTCFSFHCSFPTSSKAFQILQEHHPLAGKGSQPDTSPGNLLAGQASRIAAPSSVFSDIFLTSCCGIVTLLSSQ